MKLEVGKTYWHAIHKQAGYSGGQWFAVGRPFQVTLLSFTQKVMTFAVKETGEMFYQSTWPVQHLGVFRPPFTTREEAADFCDAPMVRFDVDGRSLNKMSKSDQNA